MRLFQVTHLILGCLLVFNLHAIEPKIAIAGKTLSSVIVLQKDGSLVGWGDNANGLLLRQEPSKRNMPVTLDIDGVQDIFLNSSTFLPAYLQKQDGSIWYWGNSSYFNPKNLFPKSNTSYIPQPAKQLNQANIKKVALNYYSIFILTDKNELWLSSNNDIFYPDVFEMQTEGLVLIDTQVADMAVSNNHALIIKTDDSVWSLGHNVNGQLGTGDTNLYNKPQSLNLSNVKQVIATESNLNSYDEDYYSLALKHDGTVWAWGFAPYIGIGATQLDSQPTPVQVNIGNVKSLSATAGHTLALKHDGTVWAWGDNTSGQIGDGISTALSSQNLSIQLVGLPLREDIENARQSVMTDQIAAGKLFTRPVQVDIDDVTAIAAGEGFSVAVKNDDSIWTWGDNKFGMLGDGTQLSRSTPKSISSNTLYMPEGFIGNDIEEFVSLLNTHDEEVNATCSIYYEDGTKFSFPLTLPPKQRSSFSVKEKGVPFYRPFAMVIESDKKITAAFAHYATGNIALGDNFTSITSKKWATAQGFYNHEDKIRSYLVGFNPNDEAVNVNLRITGSTVAFPRDIELKVAANSRFSVKLQDHLNTSIPEQSIGALVSASKDIVVGMSHYDDFLNEGTFTIAHPSWGENTGRVAEGWLSDTGFEVVDLINPNDTRVSVNFSAYPSETQSSSFLTVGLEPFSQYAVVLNDFLPKHKPQHISWREESGLPVVADFSHYDLSGLNGVNFTHQAYTHWEFAEGFRFDNVLEFLLISRGHPNGETNIKVSVYYFDGQANAEFNVVIPEGEMKTALALHEDDRIRSNPSHGIAYGFTLDASEPVIPYFTHYDFNLGGAFALSGTGWNP
ncbi:hypothetical protein [Candidatus Albibeggiatoa sp. nov. NOAA]|uniref:hypothetical protein n=1 Tax=Candidatus Albibeggiatoa sp. nov. NOAA TaxID=3162724 RepID=UPI003304F569|nr:hypothetical protein [Thiotrichaceae bacterium]